MSDITLTNGAPVGTREDRTRHLQLLGVAPEVIAPLLDYIDALNAAQLYKATTEYPHLFGFQPEVHPDERQRERLDSYFDIDPDQTGAAKYLQVVNFERDRPRSVHSVVIKATGDVCKSAGWRKGPAKSTSKARKGQPLVAYVLTDPDSFQALVSRLDTSGSYLYSR